MNQKTRKSTIAQGKEAYDNFHYTLRWLTGGTPRENRLQAPQGVFTLKKELDKALEVMANPSKPLRNHWIWERLEELESRFEKYEERYVGHIEVEKKEEAPSISNEFLAQASVCLG